VRRNRTLHDRAAECRTIFVTASRSASTSTLSSDGGTLAFSISHSKWIPAVSSVARA
jgi:hypothetical protein